jgi:hypothetical protein
MLGEHPSSRRPLLLAHALYPDSPLVSMITFRAFEERAESERRSHNSAVVCYLCVVDTLIMKQLCDSRAKQGLLSFVRSEMSHAFVLLVTHLLVVRKYWYRYRYRPETILVWHARCPISICSHFRQFNADCCVRANAR